MTLWLLLGLLAFAVFCCNSAKLLSLQPPPPPISDEEEFRLPTSTGTTSLITSAKRMTKSVTLSVPSNYTYFFSFSPLLVEKFGNATSTHQNAEAVRFPKVVFGVLSHPKHRARRDAIRSSWGLDESVLFVVAQDETDDAPSITNQVQQELDQLGDMLVLDNAFEDYRDTLVPKTMVMIYFYATELYHSHHFIFKTDDDVYVNTTYIKMQLQRKREDGEAKDYFGRALQRTMPSRDSRTKHYLSEKDYSRAFFPNYAEGVGYALSTKFALCAASIMQKTRIKVPWEDVATGVLARRCEIRLTGSNYTNVHANVTHGMYFPYDIYKDGGVLMQIAHGVKPEWMMKLHHQEPLTR